MKRAAELAALSREHHEALVLARRACDPRRDGSEPGPLREQVLRRWSEQFEPHFAAEEQVLLPALAGAGVAAQAAAAAAWRQHADLRALVALLRAGDLSALPSWGDAMREHVRFEERELFPLAQQLVDLLPLADRLARAH
ncbi:hemerythrin domain-containing protein [Ramlibacter sp.]|uniref:hemerythrin domain-containing protein n=1 Tax=Ramlibacter sp. TaxID=1917967 RepID=UPI002CC04338|nr:hemerythrin domain-containing protein [Ramlibacter sp.]HWI83097.1 hemerythrin domain-containing protein [Ramlibacter sp.]